MDSDSLGANTAAVEAARDTLKKMDFARRLWRSDATLWGDDPGVQAVARERLGWLHSEAPMAAAIDDLEEFAAGLRREGFTHAVLMGMGGSSLAPEVLRETFGLAAGAPELLVLDSTDPDAIRRVQQTVDLEHTLFIASSKSGTTTETLAYMEHFWSLRPNPAQFAVITDANTPLQRTAERRDYRRVFVNQGDIGGRYSAVSYVGMVPAAIIGIDLGRLLAQARAMAALCGPETPIEGNAALWLGAAMGAAAAAGRDKLTLVCSPPVQSFGYWVEQLIAESTGKQGRGVLPVEGEALGAPAVYGDDRLFVYLRLDDGADAEQDAKMTALAEAGQPVLQIRLMDRYALGGEFLRWEIATASAGALLGIEVFDQPNVQESKDNTSRLLKEYEQKGALPIEPPLVQDGLALSAAPPTSDAIKGSADAATALAAFLKGVNPGDYLAITAYMPRTPATANALDSIRTALRDRLKVATTLGYGPRFLHSTGQFHKGGPPTGVFLQLTHEVTEDLPVPGSPYSFGVLEQAQALGDLQALQGRGRRALRVALGRDIADGLRRLREALEAR